MVCKRLLREENKLTVKRNVEFSPNRIDTKLNGLNGITFRDSGNITNQFQSLEADVIGGRGVELYYCKKIFGNLLIPRSFSMLMDWLTAQWRERRTSRPCVIH